MVERFVDIEKVRGPIPLAPTEGAYSIAVERLHGMEEVGVRLPVGPPDRTFAFWERDCLAASPLGSSASREAGRGRIPRRIERKGNGITNV